MKLKFNLGAITKMHKCKNEKDAIYCLVDLLGNYSLISNSRTILEQNRKRLNILMGNLKNL